MPPLQSEVKEKLIKEYSLPDYAASQLAEDTEMAELFFSITKETANHKAAANWVVGPVKNQLVQEDKSLAEITLKPSSIAKLIALTDEGTISYGIAVQQIFPHLLNNPQTDIEQ